MISLTVTRDVEGHSGLIPVSIDAITFLEYEQSNNRIIVHTLEDIYYTMGTLKYWMNAIEGAGHNYVLADRNTAINVSRIVHIDTIFRVAYFENPSEANARNCLLSIKGMERILKKANFFGTVNTHFKATFG